MFKDELFLFLGPLNGNRKEIFECFRINHGYWDLVEKHKPCAPPDFNSQKGAACQHYKPVILKSL